MPCCTHERVTVGSFYVLTLPLADSQQEKATSVLQPQQISSANNIMRLDADLSPFEPLMRL
jgi:hypothetical protein